MWAVGMRVVEEGGIKGLFAGEMVAIMTCAIIIIIIIIIITTTTTTYAALMYDGVVVTRTGCDAIMVRATGACAVTCDV